MSKLTDEQLQTEIKELCAKQDTRWGRRMRNPIPNPDEWCEVPFKSERLLSGTEVKKNKKVDSNFFACLPDEYVPDEETAIDTPLPEVLVAPRKQFLKPKKPVKLKMVSLNARSASKPEEPVPLRECTEMTVGPLGFGVDLPEAHDAQDSGPPMWYDYREPDAAFVQ